MNQLSINEVHKTLKNRYIDYLKSQYFSRSDILMNSIDELIKNESVIYREPFIEINSGYKQSNTGFCKSNLNTEIKNILNLLIENKLGVFNTPYLHQVTALENYYSDLDLFVTTGTGSGKTECFLWPMIINLLLESKLTTWKKEGIRTLILYPMNALVSDQISRIRNILGREDDCFYEIMQNLSYKNVRRPRFGMYTGRTPYPGIDNFEKNKKLSDKLNENFLSLNQSIYEQLKKEGRIPTKDLEKFISELNKGFHNTGKNDAELYTRIEMQNICPDILITNYSMLELMLLRQEENIIWQKTESWLKSSKNNKLNIVIDEAHMYRGSSGGEVSLLIRRLFNKLSIDRNKVHFILTSASMPDNKEDDINIFINSLSGNNSLQNNNFSIIKGEKLEFHSIENISIKDAEKLASLNYENFLDSNKKNDEINKLAKLLNWKTPLANEDLNNYLYDNLNNYPPMLKLKKICNNKAVKFSDIQNTIFDNINNKIEGKMATDLLLLLGTLAIKNGEHLISAKVHMMFRGLNGIYACINPNCPGGHNLNKKYNNIRLGKIFTDNIFSCPDCGSRVFELLTDRRCGALYLKSYIDENENFLWNTNSRLLTSSSEIHFWIYPENREDIFNECKSNPKKNNFEVGYIDPNTGIYNSGEKYRNCNFLKVLKPLNENSNYLLTFTTCPNCGKSYNNLSSFKTRGNEPFANIITEQLWNQPAINKNPNQGKKVLLFSDSRQRAATLAKDLTIAADGDAGRKVIFNSIKALEKSSGFYKGLVPIKYIYPAFLDIVLQNNLDFFYGNEKLQFKEGLIKTDQAKIRLNRRNPKKTLNYFNLYNEVGNPPEMFYQLILNNISHPYRSYSNFCLAELNLLNTKNIPSNDIYDHIYDSLLSIAYNIEDDFEDLSKDLNRKTTIDELYDIYNTLIQDIVVKDIAIYSKLPDSVRKSIISFPRTSFGIEKNSYIMPTYIKNVLFDNKFNENDIDLITEKLTELFLESSSIKEQQNRYYLNSNKITLETKENKDWYKCERCSGTSTFQLFGSCIHCGSDKHLIRLSEKDLKIYDFWRKPVIKSLNLDYTIKNIITEEHTAQLSNKDNMAINSTTEEYELRFKDILIDDKNPIDILSCTTTMEVGIDIGSLTAIGLRNVPPMRENYQQRAGRAGRSGASISSIITFTENGPHDSWYYKYPEKIISGEPRVPWIDSKNSKLIYRHLNLILLQEFLNIYNQTIDDTEGEEFFIKNNYNYKSFLIWLKNKKVSKEKLAILIPDVSSFSISDYIYDLSDDLNSIAKDIESSSLKYFKNKDNLFMLKDILFISGLMPTYSFPKNVVNFWIEKDDYNYESPERSIEIALNEYAPGKIIVVNKKSYISGGLFSPYTKSNYLESGNAAKPWLNEDEYNKNLYFCKNNNCGWFGLENNLNNKLCPLCNEEVIQKKMIKPWGFSPRENKNIPETSDNQIYSIVSKPSYSSIPKNNLNMKNLNNYNLIKIENRCNQDITLINKGDMSKGFDLCVKCGSIEPATETDNNKISRKIPYRTQNRYKNSNNIITCSHNRENINLGFDFKTDMVVLELLLDGNDLNIEGDNLALWIIPALATFTEVFALSSSEILDIEFSDLKSGYRIRYDTNKIYADIYLYDNLSSGAGYSNNIINYIDEILINMESRLLNCNCSSSCYNCIQNYSNQNSHADLDRFLGYNLLIWLKSKIKYNIEDEKNSIKKYINDLDKIAKLMYDNNSGIVHKINNYEYLLRLNNKEKHIKIYSTMFKINNPDPDIIYIPFQASKIGLAYSWNIILNSFKI